MKIGEIAQFLGISSETIRYYEKNGIVQPQRMNNSYREYTAWDIFNLLDCFKYKTMNLSMADIRSLITEESDPQLFAEAFSRRAEELKESINLQNQLLKYMEKYIGRVRLTHLNVGHYWYTMEPDTVFLPTWKIQNGLYVTPDLKDEMIRDWTMAMPFTDNSIEIIPDQMKNGMTEARVLCSAEKRTADILKLPYDGRVRSIEGGPCLHTAVDAGELRKHEPGWLQGLLEQLEKDSMSIRDTIRAEIVFRNRESGSIHRYLDVIVPVKPSN